MLDREEIAEKNRRLKNLRRRLEDKDRQISELRERLARVQSGSAASHTQGTPVFFVVGRAKSGTSWLMRILDAHPEVLCKGEGRFFGRYYRREDLLRTRSKIQPSSLHAAILDADYLGAWVERSVWSRDGDKEEYLAGLTRAAVDYFLSRRLSESGKRIVGDKTPFLGDEIVEEVAGVYPEAKVVHIIRDGRDIAVSAMHHLWNHAEKHGEHLRLKPEEESKRDAYREDPRNVFGAGEGLFAEGRLRDLARGWNDQVGKAVADGPRLFGENYAEVRYENLLERPLEEVWRLLRFLGVEAGEETVKRCVEGASFERWAKGRERGEEDSKALLRKGVAGDWRAVFTGADREI